MNLPPMTFTKYLNVTRIVVFYDRIIQRRKHKKKRINKKWRKRYGVKVIPNSLNLKDGEIVYNELTCELYMNERTYYTLETARKEEEFTNDITE